MVSALAALALAVALDALVAEPPRRVHPVALYGRVVDALDREWPRPRVVGTLVALGLPLVAAALAAASVVGALRAHPVIGVAVAGLWLFSATSRRMLVDLAGDVVARIDAADDAPPSGIRGLVGRDTTALNDGELRSAAVESAAENLADGLVAPLLAFAVGAQFTLALGVAAAVWVKAVNTHDSVLGYPSKPHGTASARLDDLVMWVPARVSAAFVALAAVDGRALLRARAWARAPPSPNSGWPMAALAAALDVRLEKPGVYTLNPGARLPTTDDAERGVRIVNRAGVLAVGATGVVAWL
ncbi:cobalamin biosynthesis protein CobD (plasmid) [Halarchaeum sp. CBA1220]|nr:adenosylcobinamide-phosphate synthase CbiB [Halarchaeum sp. CBA1220]QLC35271.1 cobalamin biosynthesis protein CobD [Halarchaeum sp. CBA1220]